MKRHFHLGHALICALIIHLLLGLGFQFAEEIWPSTAILQLAPDQPSAPIRFTFVDVPDDREVPREEQADLLSDKDRKARGVERTPSPTESDKPQSFGETSQLTVASEPSDPQLPRGMPTDESEPAPETTRELSAPAGIGPTVDDRAPEPMTFEEKRQALGQTIAELRRETFNQTFRNPDSSLDISGALSFDTSTFDFGPYADRLVRAVRRNWLLQLPRTPVFLGISGTTKVRFVIHRDGRMSALELASQSQVDSYDRAALYGIRSTFPFDPLPADFSEESVGVTFTFFVNTEPEQ